MGGMGGILSGKIGMGGICRFLDNGLAPLLSPVQEVSLSPNDITIEMHMHDGTEVCHFILSLM